MDPLGGLSHPESAPFAFQSEPDQAHAMLAPLDIQRLLQRL